MTFEPHTGASANRRSGVNLLQLLINLIEEDPTAGKAVMFRKYRDATIDSPEHVEAMALYTFTLLWETAERDRRKPRRARKKRATAAEEKKKIDEVREQIVKKVFSLEFIMPNGLPLGDCTFGYLAKTGSIFTKLATMGKPNQVIRTVLTEKKLQVALAKPGERD